MAGGGLGAAHPRARGGLVQLGVLGIAAVLVLTGVSVLGAPAAQAAVDLFIYFPQPSTATTTFGYTGGEQTYPIPAGTTGFIIRRCRRAGRQF